MVARTQQHGGVRFYRALRQQPETNSTAGQSATARRRALLQRATTPARAQQHGGVRCCRAACASTKRPWRHVNSQSRLHTSQSRLLR